LYSPRRGNPKLQPTGLFCRSAIEISACELDMRFLKLRLQARRRLEMLNGFRKASEKQARKSRSESGSLRLGNG
jgi:hypothetical protein